MRLRVGLTGGIGSGKSEVAAAFAELGALVIDFDELAREAVAPGGDGSAAIRTRWPAVVRPDGRLDRAALSTVVFDDEGARSELNAIVHPIVRRLAFAREAWSRPDQIVVHEVPLLFETGFSALCDANVLVAAPLALRIARVMARSDLGRVEIERRIAVQIDPERARSLADYVIENGGTLAELREASEGVFRALLARTPAAPRPSRPGA